MEVWESMSENDGESRLVRTVPEGAVDPLVRGRRRRTGRESGGSDEGRRRGVRSRTRIREGGDELRKDSGGHRCMPCLCVLTEGEESERPMSRAAAKEGGRYVGSHSHGGLSRQEGHSIIRDVAELEGIQGRAEGICRRSKASAHDREGEASYIDQRAQDPVAP